MAAKIFRINYKSDFILTMQSDAGWATPFCIKFWTGAPSIAYFAGWDGTTYVHCALDGEDPTKLHVQFDDHHLPIGDLKFQIGYHFTVEDFPNNTEDEVINQATVIIDQDGTQMQVMLDLNGETAPEIEFNLPAYANEAQRIANEEQRIANEEQRIAEEEQRIANEEQRISNEEQRISAESIRIANEESRISEFAQLKHDAEIATADANAAATLANEKAALAAEKAALSQAAAELANAKATLAQQKADYAQTQGDYAKAQGDYAKDQGNIAEADHERAESDHTRAENDHTAVEVYVDSLGAFDISAYHATGDVLAKYVDLSAALDGGNNIPEAIRKGGMSVKFVQSSDNKYVQYRLMSDTFNATPTNWQGVDDEPTAGSDNLVKSGGVFENLTELAGEVDETNRKLYGEDEIAINIPSFEEGNGTIVTLTFHNSGNYGNWRYILIPVSTYRSRTMNIVPLSPSYGTQFIFMKDSVLTNNADVNYADGYSGGVQNKFTPFDVVIPNDAEYLFVRTQNVSTQVSYCPQSITIAGTTGDIENIESSINNKVDKIAGKGLSTNDYTDADKAKLSALVQDETIFGVKWDESNYSDLGTRTLGAIGKNATIGIGNTNGNSDFDNIYPWSEMKRCNIKANANGAKIVTFEGETGFTLDGSNGDVFVRIPKFKTSRFIDSDGKMNVVIGDGDVHPAFIENGIELDEIFVGAFEASIANSAMYSKAGVIPGNDYTGAEFLGFATARGIGYTLADMRYMDAIWRLMSVEFGCRNTNRILGYGYSDYRQPTNVSSQSYLKVSEPATNSNTITGGYPDSNSRRLALLCEFAAGNNITICDGNQQNIVAQRKIISVTCASTSDKLVIVFDGEPINITTDMFFGNAPCDCNYCESIGDSYKLNWHTGRAARPIIASSGKSEDAINPCRYRWIENPVGNVWQFLPDIKFSNLQMYVCKDIENYTMTTSLNNYKPIGDVLPEQSTNGNKNDVNSVSQPNYWVVSLLNDIFARGNAFAKTFDTIHDGTLLSVNGYGGYYYLNQGNRFVVAGGGFDHLYRSNILTFRAQISETEKWFLYGARLMFKNV